MCRERPGTSLVEVMLALGGAVFLGACVAALLVSQARLAQHAVVRSDALDAMESVALLIGQELRALDPGADIAAVAADSIALRVFRGAAVVCDVVPPDAHVFWSGLRDPDPTKDSLLVLAVDGEHAVGLSSVSNAPAGACADSTRQVLRLSADTALALHSLVLLFERGAYHLAAALRYRPGSSGRQPITADVFDPTRTGFLRAGPDIALDLVPAAAPGIPGRPPRAAPARRRITLLNRRTRRAR